MLDRRNAGVVDDGRLAQRAHEVAVSHVAGREAFGSRLADLGMIQQMIADNEIDLAATRALLREACSVLDDGGRGSMETSIAKLMTM